MTKEEFMIKLEACLQEVSYDERQSALRYYEEYFEEAGADENAVDRLESPDNIAKAIKEDLDIRLQMVRSSLDSKETDRRNENEKAEGAESGQQFDSFHEREQEGFAARMKKSWNSLDKKTRDILTIIVVGVLALSVISGGFPIIFGIPFFLVGWIFSLFGVMIGLTVAGYALALVGVVLFVVSITAMFASGIHGLFLMGVAFLLMGLGLLFIVGTFWFWSTLLPKLIQTIGDLFRKEKKSGKGATE